MENVMEVEPASRPVEVRGLLGLSAKSAGRISLIGLLQQV